jgi:diguanylate cyclase (GGDEF)-like protein/PAS domain S-box-containing protein
MADSPATILIVDDEVQNRKLLDALLRPEGYLTRSAANGAEALALIADNAPDLILLDLMMPGMDGFQVASILKANPVTVSIPIIMVTANIDRNVRLAGLNAGAEDFLTKPVDRAELWLRVRNLLRLKAYGDLLQNQGAVLEQKVKERTAELHASESQFRQMAENIRDIFYLVDAKTNRILYVSPAYEKISGRSSDNLLASPELWTASIHPEDRASAEASIRQAVPTGQFEIEYRMLRPDGSIRWIESRGFPVRDDAGELVRVAGVAKDITERKRAAQELRASEGRFSDMLGSVELASVMLDPKGHITYCNDFLLLLTGWRREEVMGGDWFELFAAPSVDRAKGFFAALQANQPKAWLRENEIVTRAGARRRMLWSNSILHSGSGELIGTASIGEDITERKEAEARIAYLNRVYAVLSGINTLIVRARDRGELFSEACRIAVEDGGFRMAMVGLVEPGAKQVAVVASAGVNDELMRAIKGLLASDEGAPKTMMLRAIAGKKVLVANNSVDDSNALLGALHAASGVRSLAVLPLIVADKALGVLTLYAGEIDFFHDEEMKLLTELAGDIAFAIDHIEKAEKLNYLAYYDSLTGLANRGLFLERMAQHMRSAAATGHRVAVYLVDLERFKNINDSLGRPAGDSLLLQVAQWLTRNGGDASLFARLDADHFAAILPDIMPEWDLPRILEKSIGAFSEHAFRMNDAVFRITAKVGGAAFPDDGTDADTLFKNAEVALKSAKGSGERYLFYSQTMSDRVAGKLTLENQLRHALDHEEFALHYQPKVNLVSGEVSSAEALIRWNDPRTGLVPPGHFIPVLEETGLIYEVGRWALRKAIEDYLRWRRMGLVPVRLAVNVSPLQLRNRGFVEELRKKICIDANAAAGLELEITESLIMEDVKHNIASLKAIREMGVSIAIDDFGTGFSSLAYLAKLPVDTLKIDRSFVTDMTLSPEGLALVSTIVSLAHSLTLNVVAEGVETDEQSRLLRLMGCDEMQGYVFSKPVPAEIFEARFLSSNEVTKQDQVLTLSVAAAKRQAGAA